MRTLTRKGYARIYCEADRQVEIIKGLIKQMDEFEFDYLPRDLIAPFDEYPKVVYTGKFDALDVDELTAICWQGGMHIWVFDAGHEQFPQIATLARVEKQGME